MAQSVSNDAFFTFFHFFTCVMLDIADRQTNINQVSVCFRKEWIQRSKFPNENGIIFLPSCCHFLCLMYSPRSFSFLLIIMHIFRTMRRERVFGTLDLRGFIVLTGLLLAGWMDGRQVACVMTKCGEAILFC